MALEDYKQSSPESYYYRVFCMHMQMSNTNMNCDEAWQMAEDAYKEFYNSKYFHYDMSEIDAMNEFLNSKSKDHWKRYTKDIVKYKSKRRN